MTNVSPQDFSLEEAVKEYGINNVKILTYGSPVDLTLAFMTGMPFGFTSSSDELVDMIEFDIEEFNTHKTRLTPSKKYLVQFMNNGVCVGEGIPFANERPYTSDLENRIHNGIATVYVVTGDGYSLLAGVYTDVYSPNELKSIEWASNVLNTLQSD
jgi:hypothetical protein